MDECNGTFTEAYFATWYSPRLGSLYAVLGITFPILYIPCIIVMMDKDLWVNTCYKIMFVVGVLDIGNLSINAVLPSVFMFIPLDMYCYHVVNQILSCWMCQLCWNSYCFVSVTLILNRCVFMASPTRWNEFLFSKGRVWIWMAAGVAYGFVFVAVYASPYGTIRYHSGMGTYLWPPTDVNDPKVRTIVIAVSFLGALFCGLSKLMAIIEHMGTCKLSNNFAITPWTLSTIGSKFTTFNNTATALLIPLGYILLALIIRKQRSDAGAVNNSTAAAEKRLQIQAVLICAPTCVASLFYYIAPQVTGEIVVYQFLQIAWIVANGCNGLIYLTLNITIRNKVLKLIGLNKFVNGTLFTKVVPSNTVQSSAARRASYQ